MTLKTGNVHFMYKGMPAGFLLNDFWKWSSSDLLNNKLRGVLAEFVVAKSLGIKTSASRLDWEPYDLLFNNRIRIEVKTSAYIQSWEQKSDSSLRFSIRPTKMWDADNGYTDNALRQSDMYIFCVLTEKDRDKADPLFLEQWEFYPVLTIALNNMLKTQRTAALGTVERLCPEPYDYVSLKDAVLWLSDNDAGAYERIEEHRAVIRKNKNG